MTPRPAIEWSDDQVRAACDELTRAVREYLAALAGRPVFPPLDREALARLVAEAPPEQGRPFASVMERFRTEIVPHATGIPAPRFLAYVNCTPTVTAVLSEALAAMLNQNCTIWKLSPSANAVEQSVINWFKSLFGFPDEAHGLITSGGSMANLVGLAAGRQRHLPVDPWRQGLQAPEVASAPLVVYASEETHNSVDKALVLLGLGLDHLRKIPTDDRYRLDVGALAAAVDEDRAAGRTPFCVVANAGTIATAAVDPIDELVAFCRRREMWLHVDGAFGAFGILARSVAPRLAGVRDADSLSLDPHKLLFVPMEAGGVVVRDRANLRRAFSCVPSYYTVIEDPVLCDYTEYGPQLSRSFKALKVWMSLQTHGVAAYRDLVEGICATARHAEAVVGDTPELEMAAPVPMMVACFRYVGAPGSPLREDPGLADRFNEKLLDDLVDSGFAFLSRARLKGRFALRLCVVNYRTTVTDIDDVLAEIVRLGRERESV